MTHLTDVLVVGAGISGLVAAAELTSRGYHVTLVDKGRTAGGRLATRHVGQGRADSGAQFFTVREPAFVAIAQRWLKNGWVHVWSHGWSDGSLGGAPPAGNPRYASRDGMSTLAQHLGAELEDAGAVLVTQQRITALRLVGGEWLARTAGNEEYHATKMLLTAPVPQSMALLDASAIQLARSQRRALVRIEYAPCLCAMLLLDSDTALPHPGAIQRPDEPISWIADNRAKGISAEATVVTMHASPTWSSAHFDDNETTLLDFFSAELGKWMRPPAHIVAGQMKRWRYALPTQLHAERFLQATGVPSLYFAGDAFGAPRIEGAALSGLAAAQAMTLDVP
ncbi:MAG: FAD-dependent oxidoreductase [Anaerolineales bacterium]|nr:FAD-dependent oxidoreductase [Anaerolineales bacterium]